MKHTVLMGSRNFYIHGFAIRVPKTNNIGSVPFDIKNLFLFIYFEVTKRPSRLLIILLE